MRTEARALAMIVCAAIAIVAPGDLAAQPARCAARASVRVSTPALDDAARTSLDAELAARVTTACAASAGRDVLSDRPLACAERPVFPIAPRYRVRRRGARMSVREAAPSIEIVLEGASAGSTRLQRCVTTTLESSPWPSSVRTADVEVAFAFAEADD